MKLRVRVSFIDGDLAGRVLLFERPVPETWRGYRIARSGVAYLDGEDGVTPTVAWRGWNLTLPMEAGLIMVGAPRLSSSSDFHWSTEGPTIAKCDEHARPPQLGHGCGLWTASSFDHLESVGYVRGVDVVGLVAGWGRIVDHEDGYRFERAYPLALVVYPGVRPQVVTDGQPVVVPPVELAQLVRGLRIAYRVPVAAASAEAIFPLISRIVREGRLPEWTRRALPPDLRGGARSTTR